jgi:hypothetical protein
VHNTHSRCARAYANSKTRAISFRRLCKGATGSCKNSLHLLLLLPFKNLHRRSSVLSLQSPSLPSANTQANHDKRLLESTHEPKIPQKPKHMQPTHSAVSALTLSKLEWPRCQAINTMEPKGEMHYTCALLLLLLLHLLHAGEVHHTCALLQ